MAKIQPKFQVEKVHGTFTRTITFLEQDKKPVGHTGDKSIVITKMRQEEQVFHDGYMLYFPQGHSMFVAADDEEQIRRLGILAPVPLVDLDSGEEAPDGYELTPKEIVMRKQSNRPRSTGGIDALGLEE